MGFMKLLFFLRGSIFLCVHGVCTLEVGTFCVICIDNQTHLTLPAKAR